MYEQINDKSILLVSQGTNLEVNLDSSPFLCLCRQILASFQNDHTLPPIW